MNEKESAVENTKDAATQSSGLVLYFTKQQADNLQTSSVQAAKEAALFASNVVGIVSKLNVLKNIVEQVKSITSSNAQPANKLASINAVLATENNAYQLEEAKAEERPSVAAAAVGVTKAVERAGLSALGLAMAIPLLLANPQILDIVKGFFDGFLRGIGLSNDAIAILKPAIAAVLGILAVSFTMAALSPVLVLFTKLKRLAQVLGIAGLAVEAASTETNSKNEKVKKDQKIVKAEKDKINKEKDDIKKGTDTAKDEIKKGKEEIKNAKKAGAGSRTRIGKFYDKLKYLRDIVKPKLISMAGNIVKSIPFVGTVLGLGLIMYELYSIGTDVYDVFFGDDEEAPQPESKPTTPATPAAPAAGAPAPAQQQATATPTSLPGPATTGGSTSTPAPASSGSAGSAAPPPESKPSVTGETSSPSPVAASASSESESKLAQASTSLEPTLSDKSQQVIQQSVVVDQMERDVQRQNSTFILNMNNNRIVNSITNMTLAPTGSYYSTTVGV